MNLKEKRIVVTGGSGFLGQHVVNNLKKRGCKDIFIPRSKDFDLRNEFDIKNMLENYYPDIIIHLAAVVGGIGANKKNPGKFFYDNLIMGTQLIEQSRLYKVEKFVAIGTICSYPKFAQVPFKESDIWDGYPEETNAPYGLAKKMMLVQSEAYREQYGFNSIFLLPVNLYGPADNFDLETSHVIPAIIRKCIDAIKNGDKSITLWGTGNVTREFIFVSDAAEGIVLSTEKYDESNPVNIGSGIEITINELANTIKRLTGFNGEIIWDHSKPDGQPRRKLDTQLAESKFGFVAQTDLNTGLKETIKWYIENM
ncbi:GDP-L-fucose synthase family protein [Peribacillus frigoritolerans]|uniref:GDP-L-fucose synthase family protein n=1 Tax=Peribacillus frigoritolerans TaxID=450367 RepID=UPI00119BBD2C|nr:GDP-L-fucose synthase [Peribacillus frigoritolerans]MDG4847528.1 GDP-L-fucose synthase [Peribacillus frigoritolerans]TWD97762.1 GDP-L-fucose synthase [Peribacillus frigoritolerans]